MDNLFSLAGKRVLVTGSTSGIGRAIAVGFAQAGAEMVLIHGIESDEQAAPVLADIAATGARVEYLRQDLGEVGGGAVCAQAALEKAGRIDVVVLSAAVQIRRSWTDIAPEEAGRQVRTNFLASLEILQVLVPPMRQNQWGRVLAIGSVQQRKPHDQMTIYAAMKAAQLNLVGNLAKQLAPDGVTVNCLAPGTFLTERNAGALGDPAYADKVLSGIPARRFGAPSDCVGAALLLCSGAGAYITGANLPVDGGSSL